MRLKPKIGQMGSKRSTGSINNASNSELTWDGIKKDVLLKACFTPEATRVAYQSMSVALKELRRNACRNEYGTRTLK